VVEGSKRVNIAEVCLKQKKDGSTYNNPYFNVMAITTANGVAPLSSKAGTQRAATNEQPPSAMAAPANRARLHMIKELGLVRLDDHTLGAEGRVVFH